MMTSDLDLMNDAQIIEVLADPDRFSEYGELYRKLIELQTAALGDTSCGFIARRQESQSWAFVLPDVSGCGRWRAQYFGIDGFWGHSVRVDRESVIQLVVEAGFVVRDDSALDALASSPSFFG